MRNLQKYQEFAEKVSLTTDFNEILSDPEIKIVTEVMGGLHPAKEYISGALSAGKNVVTANKDLMAVFGSELIKLAQDNHCDLMYDASVAGGIPNFTHIKRFLCRRSYFKNSRHCEWYD
ncbi:Homoserine dehydrogenase [Lactobacillus helveticus]|nr:Homoserine dehydrogenase [Lactobacillus helveticus]